MIKLLELSFVGIGRFAKIQTIDFRNRGKLIQFDGQNNNTGGSSGSGKSTVFNALNYNLGLSDIPTTVLQSRITKTPISTDGLYEIDGVLVRIKRSKKDGLSLTIGEETISGNIKLAEERLEQLIGIPTKLFKKMIHKKQKEGGFFLKLTAKESFDFLIKVLGLESWTQKIEKIDKDINVLTTLNEKLISKKEFDEEAIVSLQKVLDSSIKPTLTVDKEEIKKLSEQIEFIKEKILFIEAERDISISSISKPKEQIAQFDDSVLLGYEQLLYEVKQEKQLLMDADKAKRSLLQTQLDDFNKQINRIDFLKKDFQKTLEDIKKLKEEKDHIESAKCPTCTQNWIGDLATGKLLFIENQIKDKGAKAYELKLEIDMENTLVLSKNEISVQLSAITAFTEVDTKIFETTSNVMREKNKKQSFFEDIDRQYKSDITQYELDVLNCKNLHNEKIITAKNSLITWENNKKEMETAVEYYNISLNNYNRSIENLSNSIVENSAKKVLVLEQIEVNKQSIAIANESKRLIKNYTLQIFQESLDYIGEQATQIMSRIPNMSNASIYFEGCKEAKNGNIKDEVNPIVNLDGENEIPFKSLSGGEETAIELAVDLAVIDMIEFKTGKGADFFILDEPFTGLDSINSEKVMYMLTTLDTNKKIIIVDHNESVKAIVNETITIVRDGEESSIIS